MKTTTIAADHRVYRLDKALRARMKAVRTEKGLRQQDFFALAIEEHLPRIVETLVELGFQPTRRNGPIKIGVEPSTLKALHRASAKTGTDQTLLVQTCLVLATRAVEAKPAPKAKAKPRRPRKKATRR